MQPKAIFVIGLLILAPAFIQYKLGEEELRDAKRLEIAPTNSVQQEVRQGETASTRGAYMHFLWAGLGLTVSIACMIYTFVFHLDCFGRRRPRTWLVHRLRPVEARRLKKSEANRRDLESKPFLEAGYRELGCIQTTVFKRRFNQVVFLAPDELSIISITLSSPRPEPVAIGIQENGCCFSLSTGEEQCMLDGPVTGIPLLVLTLPGASAVELISEFETMKRMLDSKSSVAKILEDSVVDLLDYRMRLKEWWLTMNGLSTAVPAELPNAAEIIQHSSCGAPVFGFGTGMGMPQGADRCLVAADEL